MISNSIISNVGASISTIKNNASVDLILTSILKNPNAEKDLETKSSFNDVYKYIKGKYDFPNSFIPTLTTVTNYLKFILRFLSLQNIEGGKSSVQLSQSVILPYVFLLKVDGNPSFLPIGIVRQLLKMFKVYGIKVDIEKRDKSLVSDDMAYLMDICCRGKSEISIPELKLFEDECKKVRVTYNPWLKVSGDNDSTQDKPVVSLANARFSGADWFNATQQSVLLVGAGGLGSNIAVSLCRVLGSQTLHILDPDTVEPVNLAGQNFGINNVGLYKVSVVSSQCLNFNPMLDVDALATAYNVDTPNNVSYPYIYISGLDNMATRALMFSKWKANVDKETDPKEKRKYLLLDSRLSAETWQIFCIEGTNEKAMKEFEDKWLFTDDEADSTVCSYKQTAFAAQMCAGYVTNLYVNHCYNMTKAPDDPMLRFLPFMTEYDASQMILRFQNI